ncbi:SMODS domain-containing nucleotidyltransferase [Streptococcus mutans]|uniref:SMODS domain-containing nucleotidyltransferase n=1 Tax=Streptococcus mutans TaxID=1309 RepID=UPI001425BF21|nr:nucleotidyltransferase domain-containing protein [Streptococcus mutans]QIQ93786.1 nucleotidyltransferase [Streptococcus mutans]QIR00031.1 nucleotidyltransferase [Streptococcus mutans]QIR01676.1 nucleotidyltransferase [Streptococcus mutans]QIR03807.1 nucleotidyltransferase [Streptococcus mutans]
MTSFDVTRHFKEFEKNLRTSENNVTKINNKVKVITKIINQAYWQNASESLHSLLVGSYGRGTAIHLSDIDLLVELPREQKERFEQYIGNGQSALLQDIKDKLLEHYSTSTIKGDGQIVSIEFSDDIRFEILPAFKISGVDRYEYPDTNDGGSWKETNPKLEQERLTERDNEHGHAVKKFCRMLRAWNDVNNVGLHGIVIDSIVYNFFESWENSKTSYVFFDFISRDFFSFVVEFIANKEILFSLDGSYTIEIGTIESKVKNAFEASKRAIASGNDNREAEEHWRKIFGKRFPTFEFEKTTKTNQITISNRTDRESIGNARDTEQFADEMGWDIAVEQIIEVQTSLEVNGFRKGSIARKFRIPIKPNSRITFSVVNIPDIVWYWKVRNVGAIANNKNMIRGQILKRSNKISETINFSGNHYVEVYGVSQNRLRFYGKIQVPLEDYL